MDWMHCEQIATLLREGLHDYGEGQVDAAVRAWARVLELDPGNADARDYIDSVGVVAEWAEPGPAEIDSVELGLLEETLSLASSGRLDDAYRLIEGGMEGQELDLEALAVMELVRGRLIPVYRAAFEASGPPQLSVESSEILKFNLPPQARGLVSLCDGSTDVADLPGASGMDDFDTLYNLKGLVDAGLVQCAPEGEA